jgi:NAD(P)-dependent dehydrogenase (short-subunit alcohol dehydrogenase family)
MDLLMSVLVITGGASGLGLGIGARASKQGWTVALLDRDTAALDQAAVQIQALAVQADVTNPEALQKAFADIAARSGPIDGLVNSAGLTRPGPSETLPVSDWQTVIDVDLNGTFYACQAAVPHLAEHAAIVNIASIAAGRGLPHRTAYSAAKAGVVGLTKALAAEWAPRGIRVNAVGPAWADTPLLRGLITDGVLTEKEITDRIPMGRLCTEDDVANSVLFLLSREQSSYVTGQTLYVDGGYVWAG